MARRGVEGRAGSLPMSQYWGGTQGGGTGWSIFTENDRAPSNPNARSGSTRDAPSMAFADSGLDDIQLSLAQQIVAMNSGQQGAFLDPSLTGNPNAYLFGQINDDQGNPASGAAEAMKLAMYGAGQRLGEQGFGITQEELAKAMMDSDVRGRTLGDIVGEEAGYGDMRQQYEERQAQSAKLEDAYDQEAEQMSQADKDMVDQALYEVTGGRVTSEQMTGFGRQQIENAAQWAAANPTDFSTVVNELTQLQQAPIDPDTDLPVEGYSFGKQDAYALLTAEYGLSNVEAALTLAAVFG